MILIKNRLPILVISILLEHCPFINNVVLIGQLYLFFLQTPELTLFYFPLIQEWLETHADYEAVIDGANIALYQQNFADGGFSLPQVHAL